MAGGIDWFRWHHGSVTDPKFGLIARKAGARIGDVIALWAYLLETASAEADRGCIGQLDFEAIDHMLDLDGGQAARILDAMTARGLISGSRVANWEKRQPKREDTTAAARKREQRQREHDLQMAGAVTKEQSRNVTPIHAMSRNVTQCHDREEERRGEKRREEKRDTSSLRSEVESASPQRGSRLPADWALPDEWAAWAKQTRPDLNPSETAQRFADYWHGIAGAKGRKADWLATWRNWVRSEKPPAARHSQAMSFAQQDELARRRRWEEMTGRKWPEDGQIIDVQAGPALEVLQ